MSRVQCTRQMILRTVSELEIFSAAMLEVWGGVLRQWLPYSTFNRCFKAWSLHRVASAPQTRNFRILTAVGNLVMDEHPIQEGAVILLLVTLCYSNRRRRQCVRLNFYIGETKQ